MNNQQKKQYSRDCLVKALIGLMEDKDIAHISVRELCRAAGVSRSTFYNLYDDMDEFADTIAKETVRGLSAYRRKPIDQIRFFSRDEEIGFYDTMFRYLDENYPVFRAMLGPHGTPIFGHYMIEITISNCQELLKPYEEQLREKDLTVDSLAYYMASAHLGLIRYYLERHDSFTSEYMARLVHLYTYEGVMTAAGLVRY